MTANRGSEPEFTETIALNETEALLWLQRSRDSKSPSQAKVHAVALLGLISRLERKRMRAIQEVADLRDHIAAQQRHFG